MNTTLYISDLDGTLFNNDSQVSDTSAQILNRLIGKGLHFSIATARTPATVVPLLSGVNLSLPVVLMNGAAIYDIQNRRYMRTRSFSAEAVGQLLSILLECRLSPFIYCLNNERTSLSVYYRTPAETLQQDFMKPRSGTEHKIFVPTADYRIDTKEYSEVLFLFTIGSYPLLKAAAEQVSATGKYSVFCYTDTIQPEVGYLEIYTAGTSKAEAVQYLRTDYAYDKLVAFGDNLNDLPLFQIADRKYATANAVEEIKQLADRVIGSNQQDGVARFLETE